MNKCAPHSIYTIICLVFVIIVSFYSGTRYGLLLEENKYAGQKVSTEQVTPVEDLEERCGKLPSEAYPKIRGTLTNLQGPFLTLDCRYAASIVTVKAMGFGPMNVDVDSLLKSLPLGVYIYQDANKTLKLVYKPEGRSGVSSGTWIDRENFSFIVGDKQYNYDVTSQKLTTIN